MTRKLVLGLIAGLFVCLPAEAAEKTPREALKAVHDLIGEWKGTGRPYYGTKEEQDKGFWVENVSWQWQFKGKDAWLRADVKKGKYYTAFELRYLPKKAAYELKATTVGKETKTFEGKLRDDKLTVERADPKTKEAERLVFTLLHADRHLVRYETRGKGQTAFTRVYQIGVTKPGFAQEGEKVECVVSGGLGTMPVTHKGKTYYVCCTGCRDAFKEDPEKYIKEYEEAQKKKKAAKKAD
jgi:hypothetical protein